MSVGTPIAWAISVETAPIIWFIASEAAESSISVRSPVSIGSAQAHHGRGQRAHLVGAQDEQVLAGDALGEGDLDGDARELEAPEQLGVLLVDADGVERPRLRRRACRAPSAHASAAMRRRALDGLDLVHGSSSSGSRRAVGDRLVGRPRAARCARAPARPGCGGASPGRRGRWRSARPAGARRARRGRRGGSRRRAAAPSTSSIVSSTAPTSARSSMAMSSRPWRSARCWRAASRAPEK